MSEKVSSLIRDRVGCIDGWYRTEGGEMRSPLMDAADAVEAIESENAMLRTQLADSTESMGRAEERCAKLREENERFIIKLNAEHIVRQNVEAENAKLRELLKESCEMARNFYNLGGTYNDLDDLLCEAAELGVEVGV